MNHHDDDDAGLAAAIAELDQHNAAMRDGVRVMMRWYYSHAASGCDQPECAQAQLELMLLESELDREALVDLTATGARMAYESAVAIDALITKMTELTKELTLPR